MKILKDRKTNYQSKNKLKTAVSLFEKYVDEKIETIRIYGSLRYLINDKWSVDISINKVEKVYKDI